MADRRSPGTAAPPVALLGALVATVLILVACGAMPDRGQAGPGRNVAELVAEPLRVAPLGPRFGAGPGEIVGQFLRAGAGSENDHVIARSFLTGAAVTSWEPAREVVVYPDDASLIVSVRGTRSPVRVDVRAPVLAKIDAQGRYVEAAPGTRAHAVFTVVSTHGAWRVSVVDEKLGSWLPRYELDRTFSALPVNFVAAGSRTLVPDLRWFPGPRPGLATAVVRQLLLGAPAYLGSAVATGFPRGTTLAVDAVPTTGGVAQVDLSSAALTATPMMRRMMWAQLTATLRRLPSVADVQLTVAGTAFKVPGITSTSVSGDTDFRDDVRVTGTPVVLSGDRLARVDAVSGVLAPGGTRLPGAGELRSVAVGSGGSLVVGVDVSGHRLLRLRSGSKPAVLLRGAGLLDPVVDPTGAVWTADLTEPGRLRVVPAAAATGTAAAGTDQAADAVRVRPDWLARRTVRSLDVSRDGSRMVVVSTSAGIARVDVAGIVRAADGRPVALAAPLEVGRSLTQVNDAVWADRTALVVLGHGPRDKAPTAYEVVIGGAATALPPVTGAVGIAAGDGLRAVYVTTASGRVLGRSGSGWAAVGSGRSVSVPE